MVDVVLPQMGTSIAEGTIIAWAKAVGDRVEVDETICEISTDKVDSECPSPAAGVVAEHVAAVGETVEVGAVIARIAVDDGAGSGAAPVAGPDANGASNGARAAENGARPSRSAGVRSSPVVRRIAAAQDVDLALVEGSGRGGRITKRDIEAYLARRDEDGGGSRLHSDSPYRPDPVAPPPAAASPGVADLGGVAEPLSRIRLAIGGAMRRSQETAATAHTVVECDMTRVEALRREQRLSPLPFVARATVETLRDFRDLNATLDGTTITRYDRVHLGVAVSLGDEGLIVPVIRDAQQYSVEGLAEQIRTLAQRARAKALAPDDVQGATFTITSPGAAGALIATPIVPVPQVAILDLEAIVRRPVVVADANGNESIAIRSMAHLVLGWDHRAIDGMAAAEFLTAIRARLERL
jgi:pyruvate/2-oxoglutarate dehydrogenase complex dihydrolipoamide acyltransferase (E2) component